MYKRILSLILVLLVFTAAASSAFADSEPYETELGFDYYIGSDMTVDEMLALQREMLENDSGKTLSQIAEEHGAILWHFNPYGEEELPEPELTVSPEQSWEDVVASLFEKYNVYEETDPEHTGRISLGYYNTVTGEEYYHSGDEYLISASMFKIPENMIMCDRIYNGEMDFDTIIYDQPYSYYQYRTISHSDNQRAWDMFNYMGGYANFKTLQKQYLGSDPQDDLGWEYNNDNYYNAKQIMNCLKMVWNEQDRFHGIIQNMLQANPYEYFKTFQRDYPTAQKYGFVEQTETNGRNTYINCCGIIWTEEPILLVVFTDNLTKAYDIIGEYANLMCRYTELHPNAPEPEATATPENEPVFTPAPQEIITEDNSIDAAGQATDTKENDMTPAATFIMVLVLAAMILALVFVFRRNGGAKVNGFWVVVAIVLAALAMLLCIFAMNTGAGLVRTSGNPQDTVKLFFDSMISGDYATAENCLADCSSLGLDAEPDTEEGKAILNAMRASWSYTLRGEPEKEGVNAAQQVAVRYLNVAALNEEAQSMVDGILDELQKTRTRAQLYDESNKYLPSVAEEVYSTAINQALENAVSHYSSKEITVRLVYTDGEWKITDSQELLNTLLGGVA